MQSEIYKQVSASLFKSILNSFVASFKSLWYVWLLFVLIGLAKLGISIYHAGKLNKAGLPQIDKMSGTEFEQFLVQLFMRLGYKVELVGGISDYGADLIIEKNKVRTAVQAKCWNNPITVKAIQEINTAKIHYSASEAMAVTNSRFTYNARTLAQENHVQLVDRGKLASLILQKQ